MTCKSSLMRLSCQINGETATPGGRRRCQHLEQTWAEHWANTPHFRFITYEYCSFLWWCRWGKNPPNLWLMKKENRLAKKVIFLHIFFYFIFSFFFVWSILLIFFCLHASLLLMEAGQLYHSGCPLEARTTLVKLVDVNGFATRFVFYDDSVTIWINLLIRTPFVLV